MNSLFPPAQNLTKTKHKLLNVCHNFKAACNHYQNMTPQKY